MKEFNFSKKRKAQLYTIITTLLLCVSACAFSNFDTYASSQVYDYNVLSDYSISSYIMPYDANDEFEKFGCGVDSDNATWYLKALNKGVWSFTGTYQDPSDYPHFFVTSFTRKPVNDQITHIKFFQMPEDAFVLFLNSSYYVMIPNITSDYRGYDFEMDNENDVSLNSLINDRRGDTKTFGDIPYQAIYVSNYNSSTEAPIINGDVPYYHMDVDYLVDVPSNNSAFDEEENGNGSSDFGGSDSASADNYLYLDNPNFIFSNTSYTAPYNVNFNTGNVYPNGSVKFNADLNDYQLEHLSEFYLTFSFAFDLDLNYKSYNGNSPFYQTSNITENKKNYKAYFSYNDGENLFIDVPLSEFNSKGYTISMKDIFDNVYYGSMSLTQLLSIAKENNLNEYNKFNIVATTCVNSYNSGKSSGYYTENYNPMRKTGVTTDEGIKTNSNPYINNNDDDVVTNTGATGDAGNSDIIGSNGGSNSSSSAGNSSSSNNGVTINNTFNPTNNNNNSGGYGSGSTSESAMSSFYFTFNPVKLFFNKLIGDNTSFSDEVSEMIGANNWFTIINTTYNWIPSRILSTLETAFVTMIGIIIIAFIIRIVLDLL